MSPSTAVLTHPEIQRSSSHSATIYWKEAKYEFLKNLRLRVYTVSVITFPLMFYVLFGLVLNARETVGGTAVPTYLIATYGTFGVMGASLFGTASGLASDRGLGWLQVKRASPMPPFAYFVAKVTLSMTFSAVVVALLLVLGFNFGGVRMPIAEAAKLLGTLVAPAAINLIYLPLSFCSGLWVPYMFLPKLVRQIALALPPYHLSQLALGIVGAGRHEPASTHWEVLVAFTLICLGIARIGFQRDQGKLYG